MARANGRFFFRGPVGPRNYKEPLFFQSGDLDVNAHIAESWSNCNDFILCLDNNKLNLFIDEHLGYLFQQDLY